MTRIEEVANIILNYFIDEQGVKATIHGEDITITVNEKFAIKFTLDSRDKLLLLDFDGMYLDRALDIMNKFNGKHEQLTNPPRYATQSGKQLIELLRDDLLTKEEYIGFLKGNLYKYVFRYQSKGGLDDLKKAQYYLEELQKIVGDRFD